MVFDYKKEYKEFYLPPKKPEIIDVPAMNFVAVSGAGDPNDESGDYKDAIGILYSIAFTIRMSAKGGHEINGFFPYVVPPLEGLWQQDGAASIDWSRKEDFRWISMIRLPEFVTEDVFAWALQEAEAKKKRDLSAAEFFAYEEGLCVQCMHIGPYDTEAETICRMENFALEQGYALDLSKDRLHHEIYLSDPRRCAPENLRTVVRHPVRREEKNHVNQ